MHSWLRSSMVFCAISRHFPTASFSSAVRVPHELPRRAVVSSIGLCRTRRMFWNRHFITILTRRRNSGHGSSGLDRIEGNSSCHFRICASKLAVSAKESRGDSTSRSCIFVAIWQNAEAWIRGSILSCSMYWELFGGGIVWTYAHVSLLFYSRRNSIVIPRSEPSLVSSP